MKAIIASTLLLVLPLLGNAVHPVPSPDDYKVTGLEKYGLIDETYSGFMPVNLDSNDEGSLFFWLAKKRNNTATTIAKDKLVIWLNGGPGCSSMVGMMWENGPFTILDGSEAPDLSGSTTTEKQKYYLKYNPYSWNEAAHVLFVEQPVRTGFSIAANGVKAIKTEKQVSRDFRNFLLSFITVFPEFKGMETFIAGESYAGFYIPYIAQHVVQSQLVPDTVTVAAPADVQRKGAKGKATPATFHRDYTLDGINLVGAAIGNGVMDYLRQEPSYAEYAYAHGLIPLAAKKRFDRDWELCVAKIEAQVGAGGRLTVGSFSECDMIDRVKIASGQVNEYNTATFNGYDKIILKGGPFDTFFQDPEIQTLLHVRGSNLPGINFIPEDQIIPPVMQPGVDPILIPPVAPVQTSNGMNASSGFYSPPNGWQVCSDVLDQSMLADHPVSAVDALKFLVDNSYVRVLLYNGEFDLNCNLLGVLHSLEANVWRNRPWSHADRALWKFNGDVAGEYFSMENMFAFLIVRNSGHLLPMDLPATALTMLTKFLSDESFADTILPSEYTYETDNVRGDIPFLEGQSGLTGVSEQTQRDAALLAYFWFAIAAVVVAAVAYYAYQKRSSSSGHQYHAVGSRENAFLPTDFAPLVDTVSKKQQPATTTEFRTMRPNSSTQQQQRSLEINV